jgi:phosphoribosyl-dephospho-CoA transferase
MTFQPHDLLRLEVTRLEQILVPDDAACWAALQLSLRRAPYVVVRRCLIRNGRVAVGVRGEERNQRFAAWVDAGGICEVRTPESLRIADFARDLPPFAALRKVEKRWARADWAWGPGGSVGFEIASGEPVVKETSDLDMIVRAVEPLPYDVLQNIAEGCNDLPCRVDVRVETPHGGFALQEYLLRPEKLLLRTATGPMLVGDPWCAPHLGTLTV